MRPHVSTTDQKHPLRYALNPSREQHASLWNVFLRSDILGPPDMYQIPAQPFSPQRLYTSKIHGHATCVTYLPTAIQDFTRLLKLSD
ncbi:hypothetical protein IW261DRAFT_1484266 [Armillaria novae-zelandiae]|uniref:Uncharacterized protein n=1 Tax=Armillaria novae-zelandiae TaxID=153914 RepID=A0AA39P649_9AGAR|nr:hypothetical protein IW261DRAFT_1484250 [Armillaria novae-zelandiae]KAK0477857.1 hypothetical protein IW261DRAFT_1484266 [Armillaria novae-zelandiae]